MRLLICCLLLALSPFALHAAVSRPAVTADGPALSFTTTAIPTDTNTQRSGGGVFTVGDVNGDGINDYASENALFLGLAATATPTFATADALKGTYADKSLWIIPDVNGDGRDDFAIATVTAVTAGVFSTSYAIVTSGIDGKPSATSLLSLTLSTSIAPSFALNREPVAVGDFNGDGRKDVAILAASNTGNANVYAVAIYAQNVGGTFATTPTYSLPSAVTLGSQVVMHRADLNNDGYSDLIFGGSWYAQTISPNNVPSPYPLVAYFSNANGISADNSKVLSNDGNSGGVIDITTGDVDGDGTLDVAFNFASGIGGTLIYDPLGTNPSSYNLTAAGTDLIAIVGDLDGDGLADLIYGRPEIIGPSVLTARMGVILGRSTKPNPATAFLDRTLSATLFLGNGSQSDPQRFRLFTANLDNDASRELYALDLDGNSTDTAALQVFPTLAPKFAPVIGVVTARQDSVVANRPLNDLGLTLTYASLLTSVKVDLFTNQPADVIAVPSAPAGIVVGKPTVVAVDSTYSYVVELVLTSAAGSTADDFQTALRALTFNTTARPPGTAQRLFRLFASDDFSQGDTFLTGGGGLLLSVTPANVVLNALIVSKTPPYSGVVGQPLTVKVFDGVAPYVISGAGFTVVDAGAFTAIADLDGDGDLDAGNTYTITPTAVGTAGLTITDAVKATVALPITTLPLPLGSTALRAFISGQQQSKIATATVGQGLELVIYDGVAPYTIAAPGFSVLPLARFTATTDLDGDTDLDAGQTAVVVPTAAGSATISVTDAAAATWTVTVATTAPAAVSVTAPTLSLSTDSTVYAAICPGSTAGLASLAAAVAGRNAAEVRVFSYDPSALAFVEYPAALIGGFTSFTGFFVATRVALPLDFSGAPVGLPTVFTLPPGFSLQGLPVLAGGISSTSFANDIAVLDATGVTLTGAARTAVVGSGVYAWNGSAYVLTDTIQRGQAYWFRNRTSAPVTLRRLAVTAPVAGHRETAATVLAASEAAGDLPPPPPGASVSAPAAPANAANSGRCGMGSGVALLGVALLGLMRLRFRRSAWVDISRD